MRTKKSIIIKICIGLAFIAVGLTIMFDVLRPQDNYEKTDATISGWNNDTGNYTVHCTDGDISKS